MADHIEERTARPPTAAEAETWRRQFREVAAGAVADLLAAVESNSTSATKRRGRAA